MLHVEHSDGQLNYTGTNRVADNATVRENLTVVLSRSFESPVIIHKGVAVHHQDLVTAVAVFFDIDRHELGNLINGLMLKAEIARMENTKLEETAV